MGKYKGKKLGLAAGQIPAVSPGRGFEDVVIPKRLLELIALQRMPRDSNLFRQIYFTYPDPKNENPRTPFPPIRVPGQHARGADAR